MPFLEMCVARIKDREEFETTVLDGYPEQSIKALKASTRHRYKEVHRVLMKNGVPIRARSGLVKAWVKRAAK